MQMLNRDMFGCDSIAALHAVGLQLGCPESLAPPFRWMGSKRMLSPFLSTKLPATIVNYYEPFMGSAALYFAIQPRITGRAELGDMNHLLVATMLAIKEQLPLLLDELERCTAAHCIDYFDKIKQQDRDGSVVRHCAEYLYIIHNCFGCSAKTAPSGSITASRNPCLFEGASDKCGTAIVLRCPNPARPRRWLRNAAALGKADILLRSFDDMAPEPGSVVYCDPPYHNTYDGYVGGFDEIEQTTLRDKALEWRSQGCTVLLSNSDDPLIHDIYSKGFKIEKIEACRCIGRADYRAESTDADSYELSSLHNTSESNGAMITELLIEAI